MKPVYLKFIALFCLPAAAALSGCRQAPVQTLPTGLNRTALTDLPGKGVSAPFAGLHGNKLIVAGGCNFPDRPVTEGGAKKYYDTIYVLDTANGFSSAWEAAGTFSYPVAYGAAVSVPQGVVCIGGNNQATAFSDVWLLRWNASEKKVTAESWPSLPVTLDNTSGAAIGTKIYVAGGNKNGAPGNALFCLDTDSLGNGWKELPPMPGAARVQPVTIAQQTPGGMKLFVAGGFRPVQGNEPPVVSTDMIAYDPATDSWKTVSPLMPLPGNEPRTVTGGCGVAVGDSLLLFAGGVNYERFLTALDRDRLKKIAAEKGDMAAVDSLTESGKAYMLQPPEWYKFNTALVTYNTFTGEWKNIGDSEQAARAGAGAVLHNCTLILINGELKPGVRTPQVNKIELGEEGQPLNER
ncbi:MAG: cyclically-permuted mutarotase family protein [Parabacteroides sp.]|nr:cyclically-permuted mutarotase family protein [Parabacteroides sp.]